MILAGALAPAATAAVALPWPGQRITGSPPLAPPTVSTFANRFRGIVGASAVVDVGVDRAGRVRSVVVDQRLVLSGPPADYVLTVPAPVLTVARGRGSDAEPGRRRNAIVWQGFSPGRRTLVARAELDPGAAAGELPLTVRLAGRGGDWTLELENRTLEPVASFRATAPAAAVERYVRSLRTFRLDGGASPAPFEEAESIVPGRRTPSAALSITGTLAFPGGRTVRVERTLGGGAPLRAVVAAAGSGRPTVRLRVEPARPGPLLAATTLDGAIDAALALGLARQLESFVANPDPAGASGTVYLYRTVEPRSEAAPAVEVTGESSRKPLLLAAFLGAALLLGIEAWARS